MSICSRHLDVVVVAIDVEGGAESPRHSGIRPRLPRTICVWPLTEELIRRQPELLEPLRKGNDELSLPNDRRYLIVREEGSR